MRPAPLPEVAGPQAAATVGHVAAGAPSLTAVLVSDDRIDDATMQFLLQQSLLARAEEEEKAREEAEVKELEDDLVLREQRLLRMVDELRGAGTEAQGECSRLELAAIRWCMVKAKILKRKEKRKEKKKRRKPGSCSPALHDVSRFSLPLVRHQQHVRSLLRSFRPTLLCAGRARRLRLHILWWYSRALRIWQSLVRCSPVEYRIMDFFGRILLDMPYSALYLVRQWLHVSVSLRRRVSCWLRCTGAVFLRGFQALMLCIMAGLDQRDSYSSSWSSYSCHHAEEIPTSLLCRSCSFLGGCPDVQKTVVFHNCSSCLVVYLPVVVRDKFCWCRCCRSSLVVDIPVMVLRPRFSLFGRPW